MFEVKKMENKKLEDQKVLALCKHGITRSGAAVKVLKNRQNEADALCAGLLSNSKETIEMLCKWADIVYVLLNQEELEKYKQKIPKDVQFEHIDITDIWGYANHPVLLSKLNDILR